MSRTRIPITDEYALIKRKGSDNWYLEWREKGEAVRSSCRTPSVELARVRAREMILESARIVDQAPAAMPVRVVIGRYMALQGSKLASRSSARHSAKLWEQFFAQDSVADLRPARLREFIAWLEKKEFSAGYIRRVMAIGKAALNRAWHEQEITNTPYIPLPPAGESFPHVAKRAELVRFLNAISDGSNVWMYTMIRLCTGCRGDAARDLQPFQVDFDANLVHLNPPGRRQTKKYRPIVPLAQTLRAILLSAAADTYYVRSHRRGQRLGSVRKAWNTVRTTAKLPAHFMPKILRHTFASEMRRRGVDGWETSGMLGHKRGDTHATTTVYAKYSPDYLSEVRVAVDAWLADLANDVPRLRVVSAVTVPPETKTAQAMESRAAVGFSMVEPIGIEPMTSTMPLSGKTPENNSKGARILPSAATRNQVVSIGAGSVRGQRNKGPR